MNKKSFVFYSVMPCGLIYVYRRCRTTCLLPIFRQHCIISQKTAICTGLTTDMWESAVCWRWKDTVQHEGYPRARNKFAIAATSSISCRSSYTILVSNYQINAQFFYYTGCFTTLGHNCRRWFPRSLWWKKFI